MKAYQNETPFAIVLGTDDEGNFISISVWAKDNKEIFSSYRLNESGSKYWLNKIEVIEGQKYYEL